ncbi:Leucine-rich repeat domain, L domain-like [Phytophthora cactorum]|nr:Leucine-rich repeat domain, L domain-like [Phytophthora cactorum]
MLASVEADDWKNKVDLTKGDTVRVIEGDLINLRVSYSAPTQPTTLFVSCRFNEEIKDTILDFQLKQLNENGQSRNISDQEVQRKIVSSRTTAALDKKHNHQGTFRYDFKLNRTSNGRRYAPAEPTRWKESARVRIDWPTVKVKKGRWKGYIGIVVTKATEGQGGNSLQGKSRGHRSVAHYRGWHTRWQCGGQASLRWNSDDWRHTTTVRHRSRQCYDANGYSTASWYGHSTIFWTRWCMECWERDALLETQMNQEKDITHATSFGTPLEPTAPSSDMSSNRYSNPTTPMAPRPDKGWYDACNSSCKPDDARLNPTTPGLNPTTPGLQPRTPAYMMGHNPTTPGLNPTTPAHLSAATPGMGHEPMGMEPMTPGLWRGYSHGSDNSAATPAATPGMMGGGDEAGTRGSLIGTDASDGIVKVDGGSRLRFTQSHRWPRLRMTHKCLQYRSASHSLRPPQVFAPMLEAYASTTGKGYGHTATIRSLCRKRRRARSKEARGPARSNGGHRATAIRRCNSSGIPMYLPSTYAEELNDFLLAEMAHQLRANRSVTAIHISSLRCNVYSCCLRSLVHVVGKRCASSIVRAQRCCKVLRVLSLKRCHQLTNATLGHIGKHGVNLRTLNLSGCYGMSSAGVLAMVRGTSLLQSLNLEGCLHMREDILAPLATACPALQTLNLTGCQEITDTGIKTLAENMPFVQRSRTYRGLEPRADGLQIKYSIQEQTIRSSAALRLQAYYRGQLTEGIGHDGTSYLCVNPWNDTASSRVFFSAKLQQLVYKAVTVHDLVGLTLKIDDAEPKAATRTARCCCDVAATVSNSCYTSNWRGHRTRQNEVIRVRAEAQARKALQYAAASRINAGVRGYFGRRQLELDVMLMRLRESALNEDAVARAQQEDILRKARDLANRDSASEPESDDDWRDFQDEYGDQFWFSPSRNERVYMRPNDHAREKSILEMPCHTSKRALRAAIFVGVYFQRFDPRRMFWRSGTIRAYHESSDTFLLMYDLETVNRRSMSRSGVTDYLDYDEEAFVQVDDDTAAKELEVRGDDAADDEAYQVDSVNNGYTEDSGEDEDSEQESNEQDDED